jgi:hypothetical protein
MLPLKDAIQLTIEKVVHTIVNIFLYRHTSRLLKNTASLNVVLGFFITIFLTQKLKGLTSYLFVRLKYALKPELKRRDELNRFDKNKIRLIAVNNGVAEAEDASFRTLLVQADADLFTHIFISATNSVLLNIVTIIFIDYLTDKCGLSIYSSLFICVLTTFVVCFVSCSRYTNIVLKGWQQAMNTTNGYLMVNLKHDSSVEPVCIWSRVDDKSESALHIHLKFLNCRYSSNLNDLTGLYLEKSVSSADVGVFKVRVADYYDLLFQSSKYLRQKKFKVVDEWVEYYLFLFVGYKVKTFEASREDLQSQFKLD